MVQVADPCFTVAGWKDLAGKDVIYIAAMNIVS